MAYQSVFKRYELKYMLTPAQKESICAAMAPYMQMDQYGRTTIRNVYFDTDNYRLIRRSIEKPMYKEKLRIRSYRRATADSAVFVELKKKYDSVVYKRRISMPEQEAMAWLGGGKRPTDSQIAREIDYFLQHYGTLHPAVYLSYAREAYYERDGGDFRVTFDNRILCRPDHLSLTESHGGAAILPEDAILMELKCAGALPLWMVHTLSALGIYKTSFSKYGRAYETLIFPSLDAAAQHTDATE